jgi:hypothetical protein
MSNVWSAFRRPPTGLSDQETIEILRRLVRTLETEKKWRARREMWLLAMNTAVTPEQLSRAESEYRKSEAFFRRDP